MELNMSVIVTLVDGKSQITYSFLSAYIIEYEY